MPFIKDIFRTISRSMGRFLAIVLIVALGSGFYASLLMTCPDMKSGVNDYVNNTNLYDIRIVSKNGFSDSELQQIKENNSIESSVCAYTTDIVGTLNSEQFVFRMHSITNDNNINNIDLVEGEYPKSNNECLISSDCIIGIQKNIGDEITVDERLSNIDLTLSQKKYKIVGKVTSSQYINFASPGTTTLSSGKVNDYLFVDDDAFGQHYIKTENYIKVKGASSFQTGSDEYKDLIQSSVTDLKEKNPDNWIVMDRSKNSSLQSYLDDADRINNIAKVFPLIFFLVAALVALTTMTRMIDEERVNIGTYKSLGFSTAKILSKYMIYALLAGIIGSVLGIIILCSILPLIIMHAYAIMYYVPHSGLFPIDLKIACMSAGAGVGIVLLVTYFSIIAILKETPASLLRPKVEKSGGRIALEHVSGLWKRLSFSSKVTIRNIFRYKRRFFMTLIGIAGCSALLLTGFGLSNSINDIIDNQFGPLIKYDLVINEDDNASNSRQEVIDLLDSESGVESHVSALYENCAINVDQSAFSGADLNTTFVIPQNTSEFRDVWKLKNRISNKDLEINDLGMQDGKDEIYICEKLSNLTGCKAGDTIRVNMIDNVGNATEVYATYKIKDVFENYVGNYIIGKSSSIYALTKNEKVEYSTVLANVDDNANRNEISDRLKNLDIVKTVTYNDETISTYKTALKSVDMIVVVLIVCAALLAFIVLYNLNNINICERMREIATLKVLGFTRKEVELYIYRETILMTILGCLMGLVLGIFLEGFVVTTAEVDYVMFGRDIHALSFVLAAIITIIFSALVMLFMRFKFDKVDMVMSLKSNE